MFRMAALLILTLLIALPAHCYVIFSSSAQASARAASILA